MISLRYIAPDTFFLPDTFFW